MISESPSIVYCVFKDSWDGLELIAIYRSEKEAYKYVGMRAHAFTVEEWIVNEDSTN